QGRSEFLGVADSRSRRRRDSGVGILRNAAEFAPGAFLLRQERRHAGRSHGAPMPTVSETALRVSIVQGATRWHDLEGNRNYYGALVAPLKGQSDLIILPETFTSGFSNEAIHQAETMDGPTVAWLREQARALDAAITGSAQLRVGDGAAAKVFNRLL